MNHLKLGGKDRTLLFHQRERFLGVEQDTRTEQKLVFLDAIRQGKLLAQIEIDILLHDSSRFSFCQRSLLAAETTDQTVFDRQKLIDGLQSAIVRTGSQDTAISVKAVLLRVHIEKLKKVVFAQIFRQLPMHDKTDNAHQTRVGDVGRDKLLPAGGCAFGKTAAQNLKGRCVLIHSVTLEPFLAVYIQYN